MRQHLKTTLILASVLSLAGARVSHAQSASRSAETDPRWFAWLGCWAPDASSGVSRKASSSTTCIVPAASSRGVDAVTIVRGAIETRDRLDAGGGAHPISGQGCKGSQTVNWSATGRRVFLHADYSCTGDTHGTSTTAYSLLPTGEWLRIDEVRSGGGAIVSATRLREVAIPPAISLDVARSIERQSLAISTARAAAASPITPDEVVDALHSVDASLVRSWLAETRQRFDLDGRQALALTNGDVPTSVLQVMMGASPQDQGLSSIERQRAVDAYLNTPTYNPAYGGSPAYASSPAYAGPTVVQEMTNVHGCPPEGCYTQNPYSTFNPMNGYYPGAYPYGYSPYSTFSPTLPFLYSVPLGGALNGALNGRRGPSRGGEHGRPFHPAGPVGVGRRP